jgi:hypothetical protein
MNAEHDGRRFGFRACGDDVPQFTRLAPWLGISDVYGVFQSFMAGVVGLRGDEHEPAATQGLDLAGVLERDGIRAHVGLDPDGALPFTDAGLEEARRLVVAAYRVVSWDRRLLEDASGVIPSATSAQVRCRCC